MVSNIANFTVHYSGTGFGKTEALLRVAALHDNSGYRGQRVLNTACFRVNSVSMLSA